MLLPIQRRRLAALSLVVLLVCAAWPLARASAQNGRGRRRAVAATQVLWRDPGDVSARNLRDGPGSPRLAPTAPFTFVKEDKSGESPKFDVRDARGVEWRVKLGPEAQAETVATRLVWAVGYFAEEAYYLERARIRRLPRLSRGREFVETGGIVRGARFEPRRKNVRRGEEWDWHKNPFTGTRELSGLKVLMILLNNYDARKANNRIFHVRAGRRQEARYYVSDLGATLGKADGFGGRRSKNNLKDFLSTKFVMGVEDGAVEFDYDTRPTGLGAFAVFYPPYYRGEVRKEKAMRGIPVAHARWIGALLSRLNDEQLHDAFAAADYDPQTRNAYVRALRQRINQLTAL
ncbi:MAG TPA: hypothetical protein VGV59_11715 [Pyrinomonadaceae bacterium]|nr:hypothetical protein [Pyrinomonadaceae bacterium]